MLGKIVSGVVGADDDQLDLIGPQAGLRNRLARGLGGEVGGRDAGVDDVPLADAGALQDPLVGGLDHPLEIGVGQQARRHEGRERVDP